MNNNLDLSTKKEISPNSEQFLRVIQHFVRLLVNGTINSDMPPTVNGISIEDILNLPAELRNDVERMRRFILDLPVPLREIAQIDFKNVGRTKLSKEFKGLPMAILLHEGIALDFIYMFDPSGELVGQINKMVDGTHTNHYIGFRFFFCNFSRVKSIPSELNLLMTLYPDNYFELELGTEEYSQHLLDKFYKTKVEDSNANIRRYPITMSIEDIKVKLEESVNSLDTNFYNECLRKLAQLQTTGKSTLTYYVYELGRVSVEGFEEDLVILAHGGVDRPKEKDPDSAAERSRRGSLFGLSFKALRGSEI